ncbi:MAG: alkaline phosphatase [Vicinamibacterales bacterium]
MPRLFSQRFIVPFLSLLAAGGLVAVVAPPQDGPGEFSPRAQVAPPAPGARVLIIGIDGLGAAELRARPLENVGRLMREGASTLHARGVLPTDSSPNWASMIMGAPPELHGVTSNDWSPSRPGVPLIGSTPSVRWPTIFGIVRSERPAAVTGVFHEWDGFARLIEPSVATVIERHRTAERTAERAAAFIREQGPMLTFVHLDLVDLAGHESGWDSREYQGAAQLADTLVGLLLAAVRDSGAEAQTTVLVTSDHGGTGYSHGGATLLELEIPWIARGAGIARGVVIERAVSTSDTAPTVAALLGLRVPPVWTGRPVAEAFEK